jgi:HEAT repeat protein
LRDAVALALRAIVDPRAVVPLGAALKDPARSVRAVATCALRERRDRRAVVPLCGILADADAELRRLAAAALGELGDRRAVEPLCAALDDADIDVRSAAALALGQIKDPRAIEPLCAAIAQQRFHTHILVWALRRRHRMMRRVAAQALGKEQQTATEIAALIAAQNVSDPVVGSTAAAVLNTIAARVGRLRTDHTEQQRLKDCLAQLPIVDVARWALLNGARFGPMTPGDDTMVERTFTRPDALVQFLIGEKPMLRMSWSATGEALIVEYFYQSTGRLNGRFVILRRGKPAEYLCYLAWLVEHHGSYETVQLQVLAS